MEVVLNKEVLKLGQKNDLVQVKRGFALNYLIPKGLASIATEGVKKMRAENIKQAQHKTEKLIKEMEGLKEKIENINLVVKTKVGDTGKIFGSLNNIMIAAALKEEGITIDRHKITIDGRPKEVGNFEAKISLYKEIKANLKFEIQAEDQ